MGLYDVKTAEEQALYDSEHLDQLTPMALKVQMFQCETCPHKNKTVIDPAKVMKMCEQLGAWQPCHCDKDGKVCCRGFYEKAKKKTYMQSFLKGGVEAHDENDFDKCEFMINLQNETNRHLFKDIG